MRNLLGLSVSRCIRDIVNGLVSVEEVFLIIGGTYVEDEEHFEELWKGYTRVEFSAWYDLDKEAVREVFLQLWRSNRIIQPRLERIPHHSRREYWLTLDSMD